MRGLNSRRSFRATSSSLVILIVVIILTASSPANTRSVDKPLVHRGNHQDDHQHNLHETGHSDHLINDEKTDAYVPRVKNVDSSSSEQSENVQRNKINREVKISLTKKASELTDAKSTLNSGTSSSKSSTNDKGGIRRFDADVINGESVEKISDTANVKEISLNDRKVDDSLLRHTVTKAIIVRDAPIDNYDTDSKDRRKRSLSDDKSTSIDPSIEIGKNIGASTSDALEENVDIANDQVPVVVPVIASIAESSSNKVSSRRVNESPSNLNAPESLDESASEQEILTKQANVEHGQIDETPEIVNSKTSDKSNETNDEKIEAREKTIDKIITISDESASENIDVPEIKKIVIHEVGLDEMETKPEQDFSNAQKSLLRNEKIDSDEEESLETVSTDKEPNKLQQTKQKLLLQNILRANVSWEELKSQAMSLRESLQNKKFDEIFNNDSYVILPQIPKFTESEIQDALTTIAMQKPSDDDNLMVSHFDELDTSRLSERQLSIFKGVEALVAREMRQSFARKSMECVIFASALNCMRIYVLPFIALANIAGLLSENQDETQKFASRSAATSTHQQRFLTPEIVVSNILKDAMSARPMSDETIPTFIDPKNETLGKLLTTGQLDILRMAEFFLPESARQEYSDRMSSCIQRFEYFSCIKHFAWPMVKQHFPALPEFPDYQSWYPSVSLYPGYPILPYPNTEGIGQLPEIIEADGTPHRSPRPEAIIVQILENTLRQTPRIPNSPSPYYAPGLSVIYSAPITTDQMAIFYTAEQFIPVPMRAEFMTKTMKCIRDYDYLTCAKYSTWPTIRQLNPGFPQFPDLSSWIPNFSFPDFPEFPDFSQYIPDLSGYIPEFPEFPGFPGAQQPQTEKPQPIPDMPPQQSGDPSPGIASPARRQSQAADAVGDTVHRIHLDNGVTLPLKDTPPSSTSVPENLAISSILDFQQLNNFQSLMSILPTNLRRDLEPRFAACLESGSTYLHCKETVLFGPVQSYFAGQPLQHETIKSSDSINGAVVSQQPALQERYTIITPGIYQPIVQVPIDTAGRSPISQIVAEPEDDSEIASTSPVNDSPSEVQVIPEIQEKSAVPRTPLISIIETRFTPIYSDHPETVLLKILTTIRSSAKGNLDLESPESTYPENLNENFSAEEKSVIQTAENLIPAGVRSDFIEKVSDCAKNSSFIVCSRDTIWPTLSQYYPRLPNFPNFNIENDATSKVSAVNSGPTNTIVPGVASSAISETDVKMGQHGDALVTITDTRFVPLFTEHPEESILGILKNLQASMPNLLPPQEASARTPEFSATFTEQQRDIVTAAKILMPEPIREVFNRRMIECMKDNEFLDCTRDIAWPTIAQFYPRLPNFPNAVALPGLAHETKPAQQATLLPPQLEPVEVPEKSAVVPSSDSSMTAEKADKIERLVEFILKDIMRNSAYYRLTYLFLADPAIRSAVTDRQASIIQMSENFLPINVRPAFVSKMVDCARSDVFAICIRDIAWPMMHQFMPNAPQFADTSIFGNHLHQVPYGTPETVQLTDYSLPNLPGFRQPQQGLYSPLGNPHGGVPHSQAVFLGQVSPISPASQANGGYFARGIQGLTPSVGSSPAESSGYRSGSSVASSAGDWTESSNLSDGGGSKIVIPNSGSMTTKRRSRKRRSLEAEQLYNYQDLSTNDVDPLPVNITESEFLKILVNLTKNRGNDQSRNPHESFVARLNTTIKESLTADQYAILKIVEDINSQTGKASFMSQVVRCIRSLSFIRCMGIFVWPVITQNVPSLLGLPTLGSLNPFGRSQGTNFEEIFGVSEAEFERELLERRDQAETILVDWYRALTEEKFDQDYGFMRVRGYGDGEIGLSFGVPARKGRFAKFKDNKNLPSILTIISDFMEDMLDQRYSKADKQRKNEKIKKDKARRARKLDERNLDDDYSGATIDESQEVKRSSNDDDIIAMFLDKIRANGSSIDDDVDESGTNNYLTSEDAYEAFELLFGTKLSERMAERLKFIGKEDPRSSLSAENLDKRENENIARNKVDNEAKTKKTIRSGLVLMLPRIDEEFLGRKMTSDLVELGRKMRIKMSQIVPGVSFLFSFVIQMALAHARAAASVAGMMSNMALGSAMLSMVRQYLFGPMTHPKIKYVYDNVAMGPGITWPQQHYHH